MKPISEVNLNTAERSLLHLLDGNPAAQVLLRSIIAQARLGAAPQPTAPTNI